MNEVLKDLQNGIAKGQESSFAALYKHFHKKLFYFSKSLVRSSEIAEDAVEDVFIKLWSNRAKINDINNITVYLYIAIKNTSLNKLSGKATELITSPFDFLDIEINNYSPNPCDAIMTSEMQKKMQQAIEDLPPRCKMIFKLIREDGLKYKEVAEILNIAVNTIDAQMAIAIKRICAALQIDHTKKFFLQNAFKKN